MSRGVPRNKLELSEQGVLPSLIQSDLIRVRDERVSFTHDLLGDWARLRVLVGEGQNISPACISRASSPRWQQAIRLFGQRQLEGEGLDAWRKTLEKLNENSAPDALVRDLYLDALFVATNASELLERAWPTLVALNGHLLNRLLHRFLLVATLPDPRLPAFSGGEEDMEQFEHLFRIPFWPYWSPL